MTRDQLLKDVARALAEADPETAEERGHALEARLPPGEFADGDDPSWQDLPRDALALAIEAAVEGCFPRERGVRIMNALRERILPAPENIESLAADAATAEWSGVKAAHLLARAGDPRAISALLRETRVAHPSRVTPAVASLCLLLRRGASRVPTDVLRSLKGLTLQREVYEDDTEPGAMWDTSRFVGMEPVDTSALDALIGEELARRV